MISPSTMMIRFPLDLLVPHTSGRGRYMVLENYPGSAIAADLSSPDKSSSPPPVALCSSLHH